MEQGYIFIANNVFPSLLAISFDEQAQGLMYVEPPSAGNVIRLCPTTDQQILDAVNFGPARHHLL